MKNAPHNKPSRYALLQEWDNVRYPNLHSSGYIQPIAEVLSVFLRDQQLIIDLLSNTGKESYTLDALEIFWSAFVEFRQTFNEKPDFAKGCIVDILNTPRFVHSLKDPSYDRLKSYRLQDGIVHRLLGVLESRALQWKEEKASPTSPQALVQRSPTLTRCKKYVGSTLLSLLRWRIEGKLDPHMQKSVIIVAPHDKPILDFLLAWSVRMQYPIEGNKALAAKELFHHPYYGCIVGPFLSSLGCVPLDRQNPVGVVDAMITNITTEMVYNLVIAPEGGIKGHRPWKSGFYRIATQAKVPIIIIAFDYNKKIIHISEPIYLMNDPTIDQCYITDWYKTRIPDYDCLLTLSS